MFINPTNGQLGGAEFTLQPKPAGAPDDYFVPPLTSHSGANYYDRSLSTLFVIVRGPEPVEIRVVPVIQVIKLPFYHMTIKDSTQMWPYARLLFAVLLLR